VSVAAFYADCRHEVKPVRTGYRVTYTFNLLLDSDPAGEVPAEPSAEAARYLAEHFTTRVSWWEGDDREPPNRLVYLLDHQYTQRGLSWDRLKGADAERAALLRAAAEDAGCEAVLRTHRDQGDLGHRAWVAGPQCRPHILAIAL
jgi:hypothetical protein